MWQSGCALIGGETGGASELTPEDEYDLAGFAVGVADKKDIITGAHLKDGDVIIGWRPPAFIQTVFPWCAKFSVWMQRH